MQCITPNLNTHTFSTSTSARHRRLMTHATPTPTSRRHPPNDRGFDKCAFQSWAAVHSEIEIMNTKSFINKDKYQYLDSSLKHTQYYTHTCQMVLHTNVQQSPSSHFAVVDSGTSMPILQYRLFTSKLSEDHTAASGFSGNTSRATHRGDVGSWGRDPRKQKDFCTTIKKKKNKNLMSVGLRRLLLYYWYKVPVLHIINYHLVSAC